MKKIRGVNSKEIDVYIHTGNFDECLGKMVSLPGDCTVIWDSLGLTSLTKMEEIKCGSIGESISGDVVLAKPQHFRVLAQNLLRFGNAVCVQVRKGCRVIVISPEECLEEYVDFQLQSTRYAPYVYGQFFPKIMGNYFNAIGRMTIKKKLGEKDFTREIQFIGDKSVKAKSQGKLYEEALANNGKVKADFSRIFNLMGGPGSILLYGDNGVGKSYTSVLTSPKPVHVIFTEPLDPAVVFSEFNYKLEGR